METLTKSQWRQGFTLNSNNPLSVDPEEMVKIWAYPVGAVCQLVEDNGIITLVNGTTGLTDKELPKELYRLGIRGEIIIRTSTMIPPSIPSWITWWCMRNSIDVILPPDVSIYYRSGEITEPTTINTLRLNPMLVPAAAAEHHTRLMSKDPTIGLFRIEMHDGRMYDLEPNRSSEGVVVAVSEEAFVIKSLNGQIFPVRKLRKSVDDKLEAIGETRQWLVGKRVNISYTSMLNGPRFSNFVSAIVTDSREFTKYDIDVDSKLAVIEISRRANNLTLSKLGNCSRYLLDDKIEYIDDEGPVLILHRREGVAGELYVVDTNNQKWFFESNQNLDYLSTMGITKSLNASTSNPEIEFVGCGVEF